MNRIICNVPNIAKFLNSINMKDLYINQGVKLYLIYTKTCMQKYTLGLLNIPYGHHNLSEMYHSAKYVNFFLS